MSDLAPGRRPGLLLPFLALCAACAGLPERLSLEEDADDCLALYLSTDELIEAQAWHDAGSHRPEDFPWLRSTRFLASFAEELDDEARWTAWLAHMSREDLQARRHELANALDAPPESESVEQRLAALESCAGELNRALLDREDLREGLVRQARVPDDYRSWQRWAGLYPVSRLFVLSGVHRLHASQQAALEADREDADDGPWQRYLAEDAAAERSGLRLDGLPRDPLGIPEPDEAALASLFREHAPVWRQEEEGAADRLGKPVPGQERHARVDTDRPMEFRYLSHARFEGDVVLQLNYMVWLPERPRDGFFDLLGGHMDGAIWRVTLTAEGEILAGESLHVCGCYYMVFPGPGLRPRESAPAGEPIFVGPELPETGERGRIELSRAAGNHYLVNLAGTREAADVSMPVREAGVLRSLASPEGHRLSLYGPDSLVPDTERRERWLLWTMGVPSPGAMRQPGRHSIAFVGRRHFDQPDLLELSLESASPDR